VEALLTGPEDAFWKIDNALEMCVVVNIEPICQDTVMRGRVNSIL